MNILKFSKLMLFSCLIIMTISCTNRDDGATDPAAFAEYIIDNRSSVMLIFSVDTSIEIIPNELKVIYSDGFMGATNPPAPSIALGSLILLRDDNGTLITALEIDPIIDNQWNEEIISNNSSKFTLIVTDEMID